MVDEKSGSKGSRMMLFTRMLAECPDLWSVSFTYLMGFEDI